VTNGAQVEVVGDTRLRATLHAAGAALAHMDAANQATARLVQQRARGAAPKRTGRLAGSLVATATGDTARVSSGLVYAGVQHYGWAAHGISAHPFLVPVAEASQAVWIRTYEAQINQTLSMVKGA
jgi:phage gpG-like protein